MTRATRGGEERTTKRSARLVVQDRVAGRGHACEQREVRVVARVEEQGRLVAVERGQPRFEPLVFCRVPREKARSRRADQLLLRARIGPEPLPLREHLAVQRGVAREAEVVVRAEVDRVGRCRDERGERERRRAHGRARAPREQQRTSRSARAPGGVSVRSLPATRLDSSEAERRASTKLLKARRISPAQAVHARSGRSKGCVPRVCTQSCKRRNGAAQQAGSHARPLSALFARAPPVLVIGDGGDQRGER